MGFATRSIYTQSTSKDIFVAGDSFSCGFGVEEGERFSNLLENEFATRIYNIAIPEDIRGYARTLNLLKNTGRRSAI